jgi:hypothetical protein
MGAALLAIELLSALMPLIPEALTLGPQIASAVANLRQMEADQRDPTAAELAAQATLISQLQARLALG